MSYRNIAVDVTVNNESLRSRRFSHRNYFERKSQYEYELRLKSDDGGWGWGCRIHKNMTETPLRPNLKTLDIISEIGEVYFLSVKKRIIFGLMEGLVWQSISF